MNLHGRRVRAVIAAMGARLARGRSRARLAAAGCFAALLLAVALLAPFGGGGDVASASAPTDRGDTAFSAVKGAPPAHHDGKQRVVDADHARDFIVDSSALSAQLPADPPAGPAAARADARAAASPADGDADASVVSLPAPDGSIQDFRVAPVEVMAPKLAAGHPEIQTFEGKGLDDAGSSLRITQSPLGFQASVRGGDLAPWYIDPVYHRDQSLYASYFGAELRNRHGPLEESGVEPGGSSGRAALRSTGSDPAGRNFDSGGTLRTYRLALASDPGYAAYFGAPNVTAAKTALINRVDQVYESELAIRLVLIAQNDQLNLNTDAEMIAPNGPCGAAPCYDRGEASGCGPDTLDRNRIVIGQLVGAENFDIGHLALGRDGGGIAGLGVVGGPLKAEGCTGLENPDGDFYAVDYVAHEMGHQFNANHTFDGDDVNCAGNGSSRSAVEPGSGSSIMAYAGICGQDNLQPHSDPYFSERSFGEITGYVRSHQNPVQEVQSVALTHFGGGNEIQTATFGPGFKASSTVSSSTSSFKLRIGGVDTVKIGGGGVAFSNSSIQTALNTALADPSSTLPAGTTVSVTNTSPSLGTFNVTYGSTSLGDDVPNFQITGLAGCSACFSSVDETRHGGAADSFKLNYGADTSATITFDGNYTKSGLANAINSILPAGATATVAGFGDASMPSQTGFEVTFRGNLANQPVPDLLGLTDLSPGASATVNRTDAGGPEANQGNVVTNTGNTPPVVTVPGTHTIPFRTPFRLKGSASDADAGDTVTYMWEETDHGHGPSNLVDPLKTNGPLFRQFGTALDSSIYDEHAFNSPGENHTTTDPSRTFPDLTQILANNTDARTGRCPGGDPPGATGGSATNVPAKLIDCDSEFLPTKHYLYSMHFRLTARDGHLGGGGVASADTAVRLGQKSGPFLVKFPNTRVSWKPRTHHTVHWAVAGTRGGKIKARKVKISLSTDGGQTFSKVLAKTKNDGRQKIRLPNVSTGDARVKITPTNNIFFDVSDADFKIKP